MTASLRSLRRSFRGSFTPSGRASPASARWIDSPTRSALEVALVYGGVGLAWILLSDRVLFWLVPSPAVYASLQSWKGGAFVAVTGLALFLILRRQYSRRGIQAQRLRNASQRLRAQVENSPLALVEWDQDFRVTRWSPRAEDLFGWSEAEVLGRGWEDWPFIHPHDLSDVTHAVAQSLERGRDGSVSVNRNLHKDGSVVWCEWYNSWIRDGDGEIRSMLSLVHDITAERRALEEIRDLNRRLEARVHRRTRELVEANAELKSFTYSVSHDLRAPVRAVLGLGEILDRRFRSHLPEQGGEYLSLILEAGTQMDLLISGLLEYGRLGALTPTQEWVEPVPLLVALGREGDAGGSVPSDEIQVDPDLPPVLADPSLLRRVFQNLLENARKYRDPCRPLRIQVQGERGTGATRLSVRDHGVGIPPEDRERVFQPFERAQASAGLPGAGMGLAIVRRAMRAMGGEATLRDPPEGEGVLVELTFPVSLGKAIGGAQPDDAPLEEFEVPTPSRGWTQ